jgi:hypothetical protein
LQSYCDIEFEHKESTNLKGDEKIEIKIYFSLSVKFCLRFKHNLPFGTNLSPFALTKVKEMKQRGILCFKSPIFMGAVKTMYTFSTF